ncbi:MAG TPA: hypothetical protein VFT43_03955 [Candidatus Polarisedimenticolia bacterium]|nr:hypothetical protein [Candidatus Polarisedimenticolia bacterium]
MAWSASPAAQRARSSVLQARPGTASAATDGEVFNDRLNFISVEMRSLPL